MMRKLFIVLLCVLFLTGCAQTLQLGLDLASVTGGSKEGKNGYHIHCVQPIFFGASTTDLDTYFWLTPEEAAEINRTGLFAFFDEADQCTAILDPKTVTEPPTDSVDDNS